jgi:hypothetical protein
MRCRPTPAIQCVAAVLITLAADRAWAGQPSGGPINEVESPASRPLVAFGEPAAPCSWPTVVAVVGSELCTGTLIHPEIVLYSGTCGYDDKVIRFGEDASFPEREVEVEYCNPSPEGDSAYCRLAQPITELPITPLLIGCDFDQISEGDAAVLVGFGATELDMVGGQKHWGLTSLTAIDRTAGSFQLQDIGGAPFGCSGDAGAPVFVQLDDGSWRVAGVTSSTSDSCTGGGTFVQGLIEHDMLWSNTDLQITPCHLWDGSWAPTPACTGFYAQSPDLGSGNWNDWCLGTPAIGDSTTCGPAWDEFDPSLFPEIEIQTPISGETFEPSSFVGIWVHAQKQAGGFTLRRVSVELDGELLETQQTGTADNYFETQPLPDGTYSLVAFAEDWAGNVSRSETVDIHVHVAVPELGGAEYVEEDRPTCGTVVALHPPGWWLWPLGVGFGAVRMFKRPRGDDAAPHGYRRQAQSTTSIDLQQHR